jgi:hypothetical protein
MIGAHSCHFLPLFLEACKRALLGVFVLFSNSHSSLGIVELGEKEIQKEHGSLCASSTTPTPPSAPLVFDQEFDAETSLTIRPTLESESTDVIKCRTLSHEPISTLTSARTRGHRIQYRRPGVRRLTTQDKLRGVAVVGLDDQPMSMVAISGIQACSSKRRLSPLGFYL